MGALPSAALHPESDMRARIPPKTSNSYCHPGKAGGTLQLLGREGAKFGPCGRASLLVDLAGDEMALLIEMVVDLGVN